MKLKLEKWNRCYCIKKFRQRQVVEQVEQVGNLKKLQKRIKTLVRLEKALGERRYLRQGKAIRKVASPSSVLQWFPYAPFNAMVTKISKWSNIQDSCRITPKIESPVAYAMPDVPSKFQKDLSITFRVILLTDKQTDRQTKTVKNLGGGKKTPERKKSQRWNF